MKILASILFVLAAFTSKVIACDCANIPFLEAIEVMDEIFIGTVVDIQRSSEYVEEHDYTIGFTLYTFEVSKKWKGSKSNRVTIIEYDTSCSIGHELGEKYLIFGDYNENKSGILKSYYWAGMCSRTIPTSLYSDSTAKDWIWDDRDSLNIQFPNPVQTASIFNNWPIWLVLFILSIGSVGLYIKKQNAL